MKKIPVGRTTSMSFYSPGGETPAQYGETWLEPEAFTYPSGGFHRRAYVRLRKNEHNPVTLNYGSLAVVMCSLPDTYFTIPARLRVRIGGGKKKTVRGYISTASDAYTERPDDVEFSFTPEADPDNCTVCVEGDGCKKRAA